MDLFSILVSLFLSGLATGMLLFLIASGLTLVFGVLHIINFAHGSLYMIGGYLAFSSISLLDSITGSFWLALLIAGSGVAALGWLIEVFLLRQVYKQEHFYQLLLTYSLVLIIDGLVKIIWGLDPKSYSEPAYLSGSVEIIGRPYPLYAIFIIAIGFGLSVFLWLFLARTRYGKLIRAAAADTEITNALGINVPLVFTGVFTLGGLLAAIGGILAVPLRVVSPDMGVSIIIESFAVVIIGGLGRLHGAFLGAVLIGLLDSFGAFYLPDFSMVFTYILMAIVLICKPTGLFGVKEA